MVHSLYLDIFSSQLLSFLVLESTFVFEYFLTLCFCFLNISLLSGTTSCSRFILYSFFLRSQNQTFLHVSLVAFSREWYQRPRTGGRTILLPCFSQIRSSDKKKNTMPITVFMYMLAQTAITKYYSLGSWKTETHFSQFWRIEFENNALTWSGFGEGCLPSCQWPPSHYSLTWPLLSGFTQTFLFVFSEGHKSHHKGASLMM